MNPLFPNRKREKGKKGKRFKVGQFVYVNRPFKCMASRRKKKKKKEKKEEEKKRGTATWR